ncbi:TetR/AcrR family transcriptional regulator [Nocardia transvalensis]|uniref:TetR/AcrR family transcriptional regulator n=1 Tax=Nocardia transvalensis TaxID=37333 RepID=UPI001895D7A3|nr:TetR/AcrR family transcriptional regulator [Nocardia transvalensis]MBF6329093.1 TetR/AcrR family transcriptional regulator [Nocardia transvalensis]
MASQSPRPARRSQAERRAATRTALLDATITSLCEVGYTATTTRGVAERAGVSQGAQQHHFPSKAALVDAALARLAQQLAEDALLQLTPDGGTEIERCQQLLDFLWQLHNLPIAPAVMELFVLTRTDPEIRDRMSTTLETALNLMHSVAAQRVPELSARPGFPQWLLLAVAAMRGMVILEPVAPSNPGLSWEQARSQLMSALTGLNESRRYESR